MSGNKSNNNKKELLEALKKCMGIVSHACEKVGVARKTFYKYYNEDEDFKDAVDEINEAAIDQTESKLYERINGVQIGKIDKNGELQIYDVPPSDTAIIFHLKTRGKNRGYSERIEHTGKDGDDLKITVNVIKNGDKR